MLGIASEMEAGPEHVAGQGAFNLEKSHLTSNKVRIRTTAPTAGYVNTARCDEVFNPPLSVFGNPSKIWEVGSGMYVEVT